MFSVAFRAVFKGDIPAAVELLKGMSKEQMVALDPQGNTVGLLAFIQITIPIAGLIWMAIWMARWC